MVFSVIKHFSKTIWKKGQNFVAMKHGNSTKSWQFACEWV